MTDRKTTSAMLRARWPLLLWGGAAVLLAVPLVAMQLTQEVHWTLLDFTVMGALLATLCTATQFALQFGPNLPYRLAAVVALIGAFALIWVNLAVGHDAFHDDYLFFAALIVGVALAAVGRFTARGLSAAMLVTAVAVMVALRVTIAHHADAEGTNLLVVGVGSLIVGGPFLLAAWLFRRAAKERPTAIGSLGR